MRRSCFALTASLALALAVPVFAAPPAIDEIFAERDTDNLRIWWKPPAGTFTGYRVYKSSNVDCSPDTLVYAGTAASYVDAGALVDPTLALYRVQTYDATGTGPLTLPIYKYELVIPPAGAAGQGRVVTLPWYTEDGPLPYRSAPEECVELNGAPGLDSPIGSIARWSGETASPRTERGLVEMTIPDKPSSRLQRYRLTSAGQAAVANARGGGSTTLPIRAPT